MAELTPAPPASAVPPTTSTAPPRRAGTILGRLAAAVREQNWFAVALEVVIVIVGVVIGFQVTAWGNERAERAREQVLLRGLHADFVENRAVYERVATRREETVQQMGDLLAMTGPSPAEPDPAVFDSLLSGLLGWINLDPTVGRVDALLESGQIALVRADSLQAALSAWPSTLANMHENELLVAESVTKDILPYLSSRYPLLAVDARSGLLDPAQPNAFPERRRALLADLEFANLVETRWVNTTFVIQDGESVRQLIEDILRLIEAEIDR